MVLPSVLIRVVAPLVAAYLLMLFLQRANPRLRRGIDAVLSTSALAYMAAWKLSPLLFQARAIIDHPATLLTAPGGIPGTVLGACAALGVGILVIVRKRIPPRLLLRPACQFSAPAAMLMVIASLALSLAGTDRSANPPVGTRVGQIAPDFDLLDMNGTSRSLSAERGHTVIVNFWATWCPPCRSEIPELIRLYEEADAGGSEPLGFELLSVDLTSTEKDQSALKDFIAEYGITYPVLLDDGRAAALYSVRSVPTTFVVDPAGRISAVKTGAVTAGWLRREVRAADRRGEK